MSNWKFIPRVGLTINDIYLHGHGRTEDMGTKGWIEYVGPDYCIIRSDESVPILFREKYYHLVEEEDTKP